MTIRRRTVNGYCGILLLLVLLVVAVSSLVVVSAAAADKQLKLNHDTGGPLRRSAIHQKPDSVGALHHPTTTKEEGTRLLPPSSSTTTTTTTGSTVSRPRRQQRKVQENTRQSRNSAPAFLKCYSLVEEVTDGADVMTSDEYLDFLGFFTDGDVNYNKFENLPVMYVMIYYTNACFDSENCQPGPGIPDMPIGDTSQQPNMELDTFCKMLLKNTNTTADTTFEYSIKYNPNQVDTQTLSNCLTIATVNVVLEQVADCPQLPTTGNEERKKRTLALGSEEKEAKTTAMEGTAATSAAMEDKQQQQRRRLQQLGFASNADDYNDNNCDFLVESSVETITDIPCGNGNDNIDVGSTGTLQCGFVRQSIGVTTIQMIEPFESLLRIQTISVLRRNINGGDFADYFPPECQF